ncbi:MAG: HAD hydrolase family protein [Blautia sp.]
MILFTDLDGTLLTDSKELTKENQDAIRKRSKPGTRSSSAPAGACRGHCAGPCLHLDGRAVTSSALTAEKS